MLRTEHADLRVEFNRLCEENAIHKQFASISVKERDLERLRVDSLHIERDALRAELAELRGRTTGEFRDMWKRALKERDRYIDAIRDLTAKRTSTLAAIKEHVEFHTHASPGWERAQENARLFAIAKQSACPECGVAGGKHKTDCGVTE